MYIIIYRPLAWADYFILDKIQTFCGVEFTYIPQKYMQHSKKMKGQSCKGSK